MKRESLIRNLRLDHELNLLTAGAVEDPQISRTRAVSAAEDLRDRIDSFATDVYDHCDPDGIRECLCDVDGHIANLIETLQSL